MKVGAGLDQAVRDIKRVVENLEDIKQLLLVFRHNAIL